MIQKLIKRLLHKRHPWRALSFDELSELYTSMMLRSLAISLVGVFIPIYLYRSGYTLASILFFYAIFFTARIAWDFIGGFVVARYGPKHTMILAYVLQAVYLAMLTSLDKFAWPLVLIAILGGGSNSVFFVAFHTDFSKVKHSGHSGKEIGWLNIMQHLGGMFGPILGGVVATIFAPSYTFGAATLLFIAGLAPLFLSGEPVVTHQKLDFAGLPLNRVKRDITSYIALSIETTICIAMWPLFMALFIFTTDPFIKLGLISSASVVLGIVSARVVGKLIDEHRGRSLLRTAAVANAIVHLFRPFVPNLLGALATNAANEAITVSYRIPYTKGMYDAADDLPGRRIVYFVTLEAFGSISKALFYWLLFILSSLLLPSTLFLIVFIVGALSSLMVMTERFKAL